MKPNSNQALIPSANTFPVIGIGASAGGLEAFRRMIKAIPEDSGMAYVFVQHLDPTHQSVLPELLQKVTTIPVLEISDDIKVMPDHIYIIPSNKMLVATDGVLQLTPRPEKSKDKRNMPIDLFFNSLAEIHQSHAIGIVLSGTANDGTLGLKAIKDNGGITFAQDEASAAFEGMPQSAVRAGVVDFILPPEAIPAKLIEIKKQVIIDDEELINNRLPNENAFKQILSLLRLQKGTDFTYYKQTTIRRRILRRMALNRNEDVFTYHQYLQQNKAELDALYQDLLIPVTSFFRDPAVFKDLCKSVFPHILESNLSNEPIRIWVTACSTGEEAYSIAICLKEFLGERQDKVQIFATDISEPAISKARLGVYSKNEVAGVSEELLQEFFIKTGDSYHVNKLVRNMCVFAIHNFLKDPPFGRIDFISCRNVLIYLEPYLQKKVLTSFHYALKPKGFLLLGKSESISKVPDLFVSAGKNDKLYIRKDVPGMFLPEVSRGIEQRTVMPDIIGTKVIQTDFQKTADDILLSRYTPPGVVVNELMDIVHFRGNTSSWLEQLSGKPSHNLLKMAKHGLSFEIRNVLHKAKKDKAPVTKDDIPVQVNGMQRLVSVEAIPLPNMVEPFYLILFHEKPVAKGLAQPEITGKIPGKKTRDAKELRIHQLEHELLQAREDMRSITEDQEAANEELQSANEELLSGGEELQSLNEEMETSKEELQSSNEELMVLNHELIGLNEQVIASRNYAESIVATIAQPLLVLDKNMRVKSANAAFYKTFKVNELETENALVYDLGNRQWNIPALRTLLEEVLPAKSSFKEFEVTHHFSALGERVLLLSAAEIKREKTEEKLILLAIEDVTQKAMEIKKIEEMSRRYHQMLMQSPFAFSITKGKDMEITLANKLMKGFWGKGDDVEGKQLLQLLPELADQPFPDLIDKVFQTGKPVYANEILARLNYNGKMEEHYFDIVYQPHLEADETISGVITIAHEVTNQVLARKKIQVQVDLVQNLLLTAPAFVCTLTGPTHVYELVNERYQQLFGNRKIQGKPIFDALPELEGQGFDTLLDKVYSTGETYLGIEIPIILARDEGLAPEERYFNFSYQPMYDEKQIIFSILVFGYEVTEQVIAKNKRLQAKEQYASMLEEEVKDRTYELSAANSALMKKNDELLNINLELESFTYVASHDLQEPLRKIQTFTKLLLERESLNLSILGRDYFGRMQKAADRMKKLIEDLLVYSKMSVKGDSLEVTPLNEIIKAVQNDLSENIVERRAIIEVGKLCALKINPFQFRQLFNNLINNSLKFSAPESEPRITIKSKTERGSQLANEKLIAEKTYCHISISDNGIGFDPQYKDRIFEIFQRLHGKDQYEGTGIGLSIVKKIVENHHGLISVSSELNKGTTFDIYIPA